MTKFVTSSLLAGALLIPLIGHAQGPSLIPKSDQATSATPVTAPLSVGTAFNASLNDALDTRNAKPGDLVTAEAAEDVTYERSVIFPKGTKIVGHIVRANSGGHGRSSSALFVQFDKALLKDGEEVILNAGIQALAVSSIAPSSDLTGPKEGRVAPESGAPVVEEGVSDAGTENGPVVVSTIYDESPRIHVRPPLFAETAPQGELKPDGLFTPDSKGAFGRPDLKVYTPTSEGSRGTVLLSAKKNMHLDSGTRLLLVVQPLPANDDKAPDTPIDPNAQP